MNQAVVFIMDEMYFAVPLAWVDRIVRMVEILALPKLPAYMIGVINVHGSIVPVFNLRALLGFKHRKSGLSDQLMILTIQQKVIALWIDQVIGILNYHDSDIKQSEASFAGHSIDGALTMDNKLVFLIQNSQLFNGKADG